MSKISPVFKKKFQEAFWWTPLIGVPADILAIWGLIRVKQQSIVNQQYSLPSITYSEVKIFGIFTISDAVVLTGFFTSFIIASTIYRSYIKSRSSGEFGPYIPGIFLSLGLCWFYFRLWLGAYGWIWIVFGLFLICGIVTYSLFKTTTLPDIYRVGGTSVTSFLALVIIFLLISTGALNKIDSYTNSPQTTQQDIYVPSQHPQATELFVAPAQTIIAENNNPPNLNSPTSNNFISYELPPEIWFPVPSEIWNGLFAGNVDEATNEKSSWGDPDRLKRFQDWGRITSYERFYSHTERCNSNDIKGVYIQIIFFQTSNGAKSFFDWANEGAKVKFVSIVGNNAYIYYENEREDNCQVDVVSTTFQRDNVIARARVRAIEGKMNYGVIESLSVQIARVIDERLKAEAK